LFLVPERLVYAVKVGIEFYETGRVRCFFNIRIVYSKRYETNTLRDGYTIQFETVKEKRKREKRL